MRVRIMPCGVEGCSVCDIGTKQPEQSFEGRVVELAGVLWANRPMSADYSWSQALSDATDIILAADGYNIDGECTCD